MRRCAFAVLVLLGLGCAGWGAAPADPPAPATPAAVHTGDAAADGPTGDTGAPEAEDPDDDGDGAARPPVRHKAKRKAKVRPPLTGPAKPPPSVVAPKKNKKPATQPGPKPEGIEQVGERSWRVSRALVSRWQDDPYQLGNAREQGEGWELFSVKIHDAWHLGMRNKDLVLEVNGHRLHTKPQLLSAYLDCKNDREFDVTFQRAGQTVVHHYTVVD